MMELETYFTVSEQTRLFLCSILLGLPLGCGYDLLRTLRLLLRHSKLAAALEDVLFLLIWGGTLLCFSSVLARGELRGYYGMGSFLGFLLWRCTLGCMTVPLLRRILLLLKRLLAPAARGVVRIYREIQKKFGHFAKLFKKASFFPLLHLIAGREMLYNKTKQKSKRRRQRTHGKSCTDRKETVPLDLSDH